MALTAVTWWSSGSTSSVTQREQPEEALDRAVAHLRGRHRDQAAIEGRPTASAALRSYTTARRLELSDLDALDDRLARDRKVFGGLVTALLGLTVVGVACAAVGVALGWFGVDGAGSLVVLGVILFLVAIIGSGGLHGLMIGRWHRVWAEAGFESPNPVTMSAREARDIVEAPGAVSGRKTRVVRA